MKGLPADRADRLPIVAKAAAVHVLVFRIEVDAPRAVRVGLVEGRGPVVAEQTLTAETRAVAKTRSGEEDGITICVTFH